MRRPWLKCYPTQATQMLKVQTYRNAQIDTDVSRFCALFGCRGWLLRESIKGMLCDRGGRLLSLVFILTQHKVKKAACDQREDWCAEYPPSLSSLHPIWPSGIPQSEQRLILSPLRDIGLVFHTGRYETFREGLAVGAVGWGESCAEMVGLVLVEMAGRWCGDRQGWLELREKWKTETEMEKPRPALRDWRDWTAASFQPSCAQRLHSGQAGVAFGQVVLKRIDLLSSNADWY